MIIKLTDPFLRAQIVWRPLSPDRDGGLTALVVGGQVAVVDVRVEHETRAAVLLVSLAILENPDLWTSLRQSETSFRLMITQRNNIV